MKLIDLVFRMNYTLIQGSLEQDITEVIYDSRKAAPAVSSSACPAQSPTATSISLTCWKRALWRWWWSRT